VDEALDAIAIPQDLAQHGLGAEHIGFEEDQRVDWTGRRH
jgi:hypothetical protein